MHTDSNENVQQNHVHDPFTHSKSQKIDDEKNLNQLEQLSIQLSESNGLDTTVTKRTIMSGNAYDYNNSNVDFGVCSTKSTDYFNDYASTSPYGGSSSQDTLDMDFDTSGSKMYTSKTYKQTSSNADPVGKDLNADKVDMRSNNQLLSSLRYNMMLKFLVSGGRGGSRNDKKIVPGAQFLMFSEDLRISKILRRLQAENNGTNAVDLCKKLEVAVRSQANTQYICRAFDHLAETIITVFKTGHKQCLDQVAVVFGLMGYINRSDFPIYKNYLTKAYSSTKKIQKYVMLSLKTTFRYVM